MSDEQSPEANITKRERQKARRAQRLESERAAAAAAQRKRLGAFVLIGVLAAGTVGFFVQQNLAQRAADRELIADAQSRLDELGCTPDQEMPPQGAGHFGQADLAASPPEAIYDHLPSTSGQHIASVTITGVHDEYIDERLIIHNLEHGYVTMWYDEGADTEQIAALEAFAQERIDDGDQEIIVAPYNQPMDDGANFAFVSWEHRQLCEQFDEGIALNFVREYMNHSRAPETFAGPHLGGNQGELDPADSEGPLVFPPLGDTGEGDDLMDDPGLDVPDDEGDPDTEEPDEEPDEEDDSEEDDTGEDGSDGSGTS